MKPNLINLLAGCLAVGLFATGVNAQETKGPGSESLPERLGCVAIPDDGYDGSIGSMVCETIAVAAAGDVEDVNVTIDMEHTWVGDLAIKVIAPDNTIATVMSRPGDLEAADDGGTPPFGNSDNLVMGPAGSVTYDDKGGGPASEDMGTDVTAFNVCIDDGVCNFMSSTGAAAGNGLTDFNGLTVAAGNWQVCVGDSADADTGNLCGVTLDVTIGAPELTLGMITEMDVCASIPGNVNSIIEPGETVNFTVPVNAAGGAFTNVLGTLSSATAGVNIVTGMGVYGNIADGGSASAMYSITLEETVACGSNIDLSVDLTSGEGNFSFPISRPVGASASAVYSMLPLPITDNNPAGVTSTATFGGVPGLITNVSVNIDVTHTWVGDLIFTLTSPGGTPIILLDQVGVPALSAFGCNNNDVVATFADGQPDPEGTCSGPGQGTTTDPWPVTMAAPVDALSALNGEDANGIWTLSISDNAAGDTGMLNNWELVITPVAVGTCTVCPNNADVSLVKTAAAPNPLSLGDTVTYTLNAGNAGPGDAMDAVVTDTLPANLTYVSNTCGGSFAAPTFTWTIGTLANGANATCDVVTTVNAVGPVSNSAAIATSTNDPNPADNTSSAVLAGAFLADLSVTLTSDAPNSLGVGQQYTYTVTGSNAGPSAATNLLLTLQLSSKASFVSSSCGAASAGNIVSWTVAGLAVGATTTCVITVAVVASGDILATATIASATPDPSLVNNSTQLVVGFLAVQVPTLGYLGLLLIGLILAAAGMVVIRRS